ncbi:MAG: hypothetical protein ABIE22_00320 [archaeon]
MKLWFREGKYIDSWSAVHLTSGFGLGIIFLYLFRVSIIYSTIISLIILILAEIVEIKFVEETRQNRVLDVLIGSLGFIISLIAFLYLSEITLIILSVTLLVIWIILNVCGWREFAKSR